MTAPHAPLALTMGEPAGIGPDLTLIAWQRRDAASLQPFYVLGDPEMLASRARRMALDVPIVVCTPEEAMGHFASALPVVALDNRAPDTPGEPSREAAAAVIEAIETAVAHVAEGRAGGIVTNPINKKSLYDAGFRHPGHTEFLGMLAERFWPETAHEPVMLLAGPDLMAIPITVHIPLADVPGALTSKRIRLVARIADHELHTRFGIDRPRLALAGLNPHAGENGSMGREERTILEPAIAELREEGIDIVGPLPADTMFHPRARAQYDCALACYHDQALIPVKTLAFDESVNVTLGLPFVRTSPDHGTAFDIAASGKARPDSLIAALRLAARLSARGAG
ncbi:4-hydroxythreonine-4-phosphate dehydrogenase PdxA [Breoghania sp. L-A4]|uniref:4-hydroxythreonine-4-phosphate dehydrogenase PdxA n=1 Tax=Breoghania sp. L-A4 TaxID=2304600 RepID=UPI000E35CD0C|nr:4-hydroxythreonine-4-phosphate dehydrogenase PdxA [Breoghania sp. L-A4]AXS40602.1 4-hydroxythreonine-4-phosphate dehydrogenase PdxA [Breoghania sp. L-A4]